MNGLKWMMMLHVDFAIHLVQQATQRVFLYAHKSNILHAQAALTGLTVSPDESILMVVPLFHVLAWGTPYFAPMFGLKLVMPGLQMEGEPLFDLIEKEKVTLAFGVPTVWMGLLSLL